MFIKHGDATSTISFDKTSNMCSMCKSQIMIVDSKKRCLCSGDDVVEKIKKILTQTENIANNQETK